MDLYKELLINALQKQDIHVTFPDLKISAEQIVELKCYRALKQIRDVLDDDTLNDKDCFEKIERIICVFEENSGRFGNRHDF